MKLGIITFHRAINYGAILQTYALNKVTQNIGFDSEVINYRYNKVDKEYILFSKKTLKKIMSDIYYYPIKKTKIKKFEKFMNNYIKISKKIYKDESDLKQSEKIYDVYLTGSDQVFNYRITGKDENYFLKFVEDSSKKNSYAASFGMDTIPNEYANEIKENLSKFNNISVREKKGIEIVNKLIKRQARIDVDPTFLLSKADWSKIALKPKENKYILLFVMQKNESIYKFTEELSVKTGLPVIYITDSYKKMLKAKHKKIVSPEEWLGYFENAEYIVTNSFHGLAFSINLNKKFFVEFQKEPATGNSRIETLLEEYNLLDRLIIEGKNDNIDKEILWEYVNDKLEKNRQNSINYLKGLRNE